MVEGAAQEKVCQTDKCSAHSDNKNCYGQSDEDNLSQSNRFNIHRHQVAPDHQPVIPSAHSTCAGACKHLYPCSVI